MTADYEILVAAWAVRDREFAGRYGRWITGVLDCLFGHFALRDVVRHSLAYFRETGNLLPKPALLEDMVRVAVSTGGQDLYEAMVETLFTVDLTGREHVEATVVEQAREGAILSMRPEDWRGRAKAYVARLKEIDRLLEPPIHAPLILTEGVPEDVNLVAAGTPLGIPTLDAALDGGGGQAGELIAVLGPYNTGKTRFMHSVAVNAAKAGKAVFVLSHEGGKRQTIRRLAKLVMGRDTAGLSQREMSKAFEKIPIAVLSIKGTGYGMDSLDRDVREAEDRLGRRVELVVRDYGELASGRTRDWQAVAAAYMEFKEWLLDSNRLGLDACQKNREGNISYFSILKDADVVLELTGDRNGSLVCSIARNREGPGGVSAFLSMDRVTGLVQERYNRIEVENGGIPEEGTTDQQQGQGQEGGTGGGQADDGPAGNQVHQGGSALGQSRLARHQGGGAGPLRLAPLRGEGGAGAGPA